MLKTRDLHSGMQSLTSGIVLRPFAHCILSLQAELIKKSYTYSSLMHISGYQFPIAPLARTTASSQVLQ